MFHSARLKLTAWYLLIIMIISIAFSGFIYFGTTRELDRVLRIQRFHLQHPEVQLQILPNKGIQFQPESYPAPDPQVIQESRTRVLESLVGVNVIILFISSLAGYFLAGLTLAPIKKMVDEQHRFVTDASHELRTPLTSLRSEIEVNLRNKNLSLEVVKKLLQSNLEEVEHLQILSDNLLELSQMPLTAKANGKVVYEIISLQNVLEEAIKKVMPIAKKKKISIASGEIGQMVKGEKQSYIQLFVIFLDNAIKYSPKNTTVTISSHQTDGHVKVTITDEGIGIQEKDIPHIFDRFYRADFSRSKQSVEGYGLGLSIAKKILTTYNGSVSVKSIGGKGTTFTVSLPAGK